MHTALLELNLLDDATTALLQRLCGVADEFDRQSAAGGSSHRDPRALRQLVGDSPARRVPLILRNRERFRLRER